MTAADGPQVPWEQRALSFGAYAEDYDRSRPGYPAAALDWLLPAGARRVIDVGAGTGKLTTALLARGLSVVAVEPDPAMLAVLVARLPAADAHEAGAETLPVADGSVDAVLAGQAWHWFDQARALVEARRVLRPGGWLGLIWNAPDLDSPWDRELARLDGTWHGGGGGGFWPPGLPREGTEARAVPWTQDMTPAQVTAEHATHSAIALLPAEQRRQRLAAIEAHARDEAGRRGSPTVRVSRVSRCFRRSP